MDRCYSRIMYIQEKLHLPEEMMLTLSVINTVCFGTDTKVDHLMKRPLQSLKSRQEKSSAEFCVDYFGGFDVLI